MHLMSDNTSGAAPEVMAAILAANAGYVGGYGNEPAMDRVRAMIRNVFEAPEAAVYLVATGTAANALALSIFVPPWGAVLCHKSAHIALDECGAPEFYMGGARLALVDGAGGKMTPQTLAQSIATTGQSGVHGMQRAMLSITNLTEAGTHYTPSEVASLTALARADGLPCHMDGARFANALVASGASPAEMTWRAGIDVLSFGGTKNGCLGVEAVVIFDPAKAWEFELRRKRGGHLFSKHRYLSAQMEAYLTDGLWLRLAACANATGQRLAAGIKASPGMGLCDDVAANLMFPTFPPGTHDRIEAQGVRYYRFPDTQTGQTARFVTSWSTTDADVDAVLTALRGA
jgi:threonine aldolase